MKKRIKYYKAVILVFVTGISGISSAQDLSSFIKEALANNPALKAYELKYEIATESIEESTALPNTEFGVGYFISEPETRTGAQKARVSVKQMIPWFGTLTARENYAGSLAEATYVDVVIMQRKLLLAMNKSYYQLYALKNKEVVIRDKMALLKTYETLALTSVEVGKASAVDVLKLQIRQNELEALAETLKNRFNAEKAIFKQLLNREDSLSITFPEHIVLPEEDFKIENDSLRYHPELVKYEKLYNSVEKSILLNEKEANPNIGFGLDYIAVSQRPNMTFSDNGKDIWMPMVSLSIPIFNNSYRARSQQLEIRKKEINSFKNEQENKLQALLTEAFENRNAARRNYETQIKNLERAKDAEEILLKTYENGTVDFDDILDIQELQLEFQLKKLDALSYYYIAWANINYLINT